VFQTILNKDCNICNDDDSRPVCLHFENGKHAIYIMKTSNTIAKRTCICKVLFKIKYHEVTSYNDIRLIYCLASPLYQDLVTFV